MGSGSEHCFQRLPLCSTPTTMEVIDLTENVSFHGNSSFYDEFLEDDEVSDLDARQVPLTAFPSSSTACENYEDLSSLEIGSCLSCTICRHSSKRDSTFPACQGL